MMSEEFLISNKIIHRYTSFPNTTSDHKKMKKNKKKFVIYIQSFSPLAFIIIHFNHPSTHHPTEKNKVEYFRIIKHDMKIMQNHFLLKIKYARRESR